MSGQIISVDVAIERIIELNKAYDRLYESYTDVSTKHQALVERINQQTYELQTISENLNASEKEYQLLKMAHDAIKEDNAKKDEYIRVIDTLNLAHLKKGESLEAYIKSLESSLKETAEQRDRSILNHEKDLETTRIDIEKLVEQNAQLEAQLMDMQVKVTETSGLLKEASDIIIALTGQSNNEEVKPS